MDCQFGVKSRRNKEKPGFSLLEMMTSVSLIIIITSLFVANYRDSNRRTDLTMTAQKLVADLHAAQNNTLGLIKYGTIVPVGGWGVHMSIDEPNRYYVYAELDRPASNEPGRIWTAAPGFGVMDDGESDEALGARIVKLSDKIRIMSITTGSGGTADTVDIGFLPPDPKTSITFGAATSSSVTIKLTDGTGQVKTVRVNFLGLAEVID